MITEQDVIKAIVKCKKENGRTNHYDVMKELSIDDITLLKFNRTLTEKGYITTTMEDISITSLGMSAYNELKPVKKIKKSIFNFSKFTFQRFIDVIIGIVVGIVVSFIVYHFGWQ